VRVCFERKLPEIRSALRGVGAVLVDATTDPSQATDALLQAIACIGSHTVAMYTETMHSGLEVFTRMQGSLFLLGPLFHEQWQDLLGQWLQGNGVSSQPGDVDGELRQESRFSRHWRANLNWPRSEFN
jgi:hypothetical protein